VDAVERGIERRAARVWAPDTSARRWRPAGFVQPLNELRVARTAGLRRALELADPSGGVEHHAHPVLGIA
jgi:hypothetical protein